MIAPTRWLPLLALLLQSGIAIAVEPQWKLVYSDDDGRHYVDTASIN